MARLVVLRFEDDEVAEGFIGWQKYQSNIVGMATVEGMFQTPTKFHSQEHKSSGWRYSEKWGWWICRDCGAPSVGYGENIKAVIFDAKNLLERPSKNTLERVPTDPKVDPETGERYGGSGDGDFPDDRDNPSFNSADGKLFNNLDNATYDPRFPYRGGRLVVEVPLPAEDPVDDTQGADAAHPVHNNRERDVPTVRDSSATVTRPAGGDE